MRTFMMEIVNTTATFAVDKKFDLYSLAIEESVLAPENKRRKNKQLLMRGFKAVPVAIMVNDLKRVTALVYASGSIVLVGATSAEQAEQAQQLFTQRFACAVTRKLEIRNFVSHIKLNERLNLTLLTQKATQGAGFSSASYEPEIFPALVVSSLYQKGKATIFSSGHVNITGCPTIESSDSMLSLLKRTLF